MQVLCSDGTSRVVPDDQVVALTDVAVGLALKPVDLDDLVHDCCDATASARVNTDPGLPDNIEDAQDVAYRDASRIGSQVNNSGLQAQVAFLLAELGYTHTEQQLRSIEHSSPAA